MKFARVGLSQVQQVATTESEAVALLLSCASAATKDGAQTRRLFEMLNTPAAFLAVLVLVVAVNSYLFFGYDLPRTTTPPASPPQTERTTGATTTSERTQPTTTMEETQSEETPEETPSATATGTATPTATATAMLSL